MTTLYDHRMMEATDFANGAKQASHSEITSQPIASESWAQSANSGKKEGNVGTVASLYTGGGPPHRQRRLARPAPCLRSTTSLPATAFSAKGSIIQPAPFSEGHRRHHVLSLPSCLVMKQPLPFGSSHEMTACRASEEIPVLAWPTEVEGKEPGGQRGNFVASKDRCDTAVRVA